jgi:hypothetical protein
MGREQETGSTGSTGAGEAGTNSPKTYNVDIGGKKLTVSEASEGNQNQYSTKDDSGLTGKILGQRAFSSELAIKVVGFVLTAVVGGFLLQVYKTADWQNRRDIEAQRNTIAFQRNHFEKISRDLERRYFLSRKVLDMVMDDDIAENMLEKWNDTILGWNESYHYYQLLLKTFVDRENPSPYLGYKDFRYAVIDQDFNYHPSSNLDHDCSQENGGRCPFPERFCPIEDVKVRPPGKEDAVPVDFSRYKVPACLDNYCRKRGRFFNMVCMHPYEHCLKISDPKMFARKQKSERAKGNTDFGKTQCHTSNFLHFMHKCNSLTVGGVLSPLVNALRRAKKNQEENFSISPALKAQVYADLRCALSDIYVNQQRFYKVINHQLKSSIDNLNNRKKSGIYNLMMETLETLMPFKAMEAEIED